MIYYSFSDRAWFVFVLLSWFTSRSVAWSQLSNSPSSQTSQAENQSDQNLGSNYFSHHGLASSGPLVGYSAWVVLWRRSGPCWCAERLRIRPWSQLAVFRHHNLRLLLPEHLTFYRASQNYASSVTWLDWVRVAFQWFFRSKELGSDSSGYWRPSLSYFLDVLSRMSSY